MDIVAIYVAGETFLELPLTARRPRGFHWRTRLALTQAAGFRSVKVEPRHDITDATTNTVLSRDSSCSRRARREQEESRQSRGLK